MDCLIICGTSLERGRINQRKKQSWESERLVEDEVAFDLLWRCGRGLAAVQESRRRGSQQKEEQMMIWIPGIKNQPGWPCPLRSGSQSGCSQGFPHLRASRLQALNRKSTRAWVLPEILLSTLVFIFRLVVSHLRLITTLCEHFCDPILMTHRGQGAHKMMETRDSSSWLHSRISSFLKPQCWGPTSRDSDLFGLCLGPGHQWVGRNFQGTLIFKNMWNVDLSKHTT